MDTILAVLAVAADLALATGTRMVEPAAAERGSAAAGVGHDRWFTALGQLKERGLIQLATAEPSQVVLIALTDAGLLHHLRATRRDLADLQERLWQAACEVAGGGAVALADQLGEPALVIECLLDGMVDQRRLVYSKAPGRRFRVHRVNSRAEAAPERGSR